MDALIQSILNDPTILAVYQTAQIIGITVDALLFVAMIFALVKLWHYRPQFVLSPHKWQRHVKPKKQPSLRTPVVLAAWKRVEDHLKEGSPQAVRLAVIEADGAVDEVLKRMGLLGETFAERLGRVSPERYASVERVWDAHRLRNNIVHTPDFHVAAAKAEQAVRAYGAFLKEVKAL